jgi:hypothetical protein
VAAGNAGSTVPVVLGMGTRSQAVQARSRVLVPLDAAPAPAAADALELLRPDLSPLPYQGRELALARVAAWLDSDSYPCYLVGGPPAVGKTRLALEAGRRVPPRWLAGWLRPGEGATACAAVRACAEPTLILVDDADLRADLFPLLDQVHEHWRGRAVPGWAPDIRILAVTSSAEALAQRIEARFPRDRDGHAPHWARLDPGEHPSSPDQVFHDAARAFAAVLGAPAAVPSAAVPSARAPGAAVPSARVPSAHPPPLPGGGGAEPFGMIAARALLLALDAARGEAAAAGERDPRAATPASLAARLMRHEQDRWNAATEWNWGDYDPPSRALRDRVMAALTLLGADSEAAAENVLQLVPMPRNAPAGQRRVIASWAASLYPPGTMIGISPRLTAEWFIVRQLAGSPRLARGVRAELTGQQRTRLLGLVGRAAGRVRDAGRLFTELAAENATSLVIAITWAAIAEDPQRADPLIADAIRTLHGREPGALDLVQLARLSALTTGSMRQARIAIAEARVAHYRVLAAQSAIYWFFLAMELRKLAAVLAGLRLDERWTVSAEMQHLEEAFFGQPATRGGRRGFPGELRSFPAKLRYLRLDPRQEQAAMAVLRAARRVQRDYQDDWRWVVRRLVRELQVDGLHDDAVRTAREAVTVDRAEMAAGPSADGMPSLGSAITLSLLGDALGQAGRYPEAVPVTREAAGRWQAQGGQVRELEELGYPETLLALSGQLGQLGQAAEARAARDQALWVVRQSLGRGGTYRDGKSALARAPALPASEQDRPARLLAERAYADLGVDDAAASRQPASGRRIMRADGQLDVAALLAEFAAFWRRYGTLPDKDGAYHAASPEHVLKALIERLMAGAAPLPHQWTWWDEPQWRQWPRWKRWYAGDEISFRIPFLDATGAEAEQRVVIHVMVAPGPRRRRRRAALAHGLAAMDDVLTRWELESGALLVIERRLRSVRGSPHPRLSRRRTPRGRSITLLRL